MYIVVNTQNKGYLMKINWFKILIFFIFSAIISGPSAQGSNQGTDLQNVKELEISEKSLDEKILEYNTLLANYGKLIKQDVRYTPMKTHFRSCLKGKSFPQKDDPACKSEDYIEVESYEFIQAAFNYTEVVGSKVKILRLYFDGDSLLKVESRITEENFQENSKYDSKVVDPTPTTVDNKDIVIMNRFNEGIPYEVQLGNIENTVSNPLRIKFKREFYIEHLQQFEVIYRYAEKYTQRYGTNKNTMAIKYLKKSLKY